ncbi:pyridoxamine 5'-phosphate oxidase family protein [Mycobacterium gordonae]|uniref:pyridoxamine 5'-phosphate oxidase family protein n=1 Tax=Mycobacterium gordonae TaxID=1778 RepID=UPI000AB246E2
MFTRQGASAATAIAPATTDRCEPQHRESFDALARALARRKYATLATLGEDGRPHATEVVYAMSKPGDPVCFYVTTRTTTRKVSNIRARASVAFVVPLARAWAPWFPPRAAQSRHGGGGGPVRTKTRSGPSVLRGSGAESCRPSDASSRTAATCASSGSGPILSSSPTGCLRHRDCAGGGEHSHDIALSADRKAASAGSTRLARRRCARCVLQHLLQLVQWIALGRVEPARRDFPPVG